MTEKAQKRLGTLDGMERLQNHVHVSKTKELMYLSLLIDQAKIDKSSF
jgi:hypothetical protein